MNRLPCSNEQMAIGASDCTNAGKPPANELPPVLDSQTVLQGRSSVAIEHNGAVYRLQTTRQGKLILTK